MDKQDDIVLYEGKGSMFRVRREFDKLLGTIFVFTQSIPDVGGFPIEVSTRIKDGEAEKLAEFIQKRIS